MSKISNLDYGALNVSGDNYLQWAVDTQIILKSRGLGETIIAGNQCSERERYKAIFLIRHHLNEALKNQYLTVDNPLELWDQLQERYGHQKRVLLPKTKFEWLNLRFMDYGSVEEYNSAMFKIVSVLKLCGEDIKDSDMLEKTLSTFHATNSVLQEQYRERNFKTYSSLITCLLLAEQNNQLLMRNNQLRPPGSTPIPDSSKQVVETKKESNNVQHNDSSGHGRGKSHGRGRGGKKQGRGRGHGRGNSTGSNRGSYRGKGASFKPQQKTEACNRCGMGNHWAKNCRTSWDVVERFRAKQQKNPEANMVYLDGDNDMDHDQDDSRDHDNHEEDHMEYETSDLLK